MFHNYVTHKFLFFQNFHNLFIIYLSSCLLSTQRLLIISPFFFFLIKSLFDKMLITISIKNSSNCISLSLICNSPQSLEYELKTSFQHRISEELYFGCHKEIMKKEDVIRWKSPVILNTLMLFWPILSQRKTSLVVFL